MRKFLHVVGARPNFMKLAPVHRQLSEQSGVEQIIVHTGQHYDSNMSDVFFEQLRIPAPQINLQVGSGSHAQQTAQVMSRFETAVLEQKPDVVLVYGDVNSTAAAALVCAKLMISVAHVEAGLRSFDRTMPEEVNRVITDQLSDWLFTPSRDGDRNLEREGIAPDRIHFVGNVMIDTLIQMLPIVKNHRLGDLPENFVLITLHRPGNVDDISWLKRMFDVIRQVLDRVPVVFPIHPRTRQRLHDAGVELNGNQNLHLLEPRPYLDFLALQMRACAVVTDSGGIQEETTFLKVPCITVRENTERPITVEEGTNVLVGRDVDRVLEELNRTLSGGSKPSRIPDLWDGHAADRIATILCS